MDINITTKFNIGDSVYIAECYEDFFPDKQPHIIKGIAIDADNSGMQYRYYVGDNRRIGSMLEDRLFTSYEECTKWCDEHNK